MTPSLEGLPTKAEELPSAHEARLIPTGRQTGISGPRGKNRQNSRSKNFGWGGYDTMLQKLTYSSSKNETMHDKWTAK